MALRSIRLESDLPGGHQKTTADSALFRGHALDSYKHLYKGEWMCPHEFLTVGS